MKPKFLSMFFCNPKFLSIFFIAIPNFYPYFEIFKTQILIHISYLVKPKFSSIFFCNSNFISIFFRYSSLPVLQTLAHSPILLITGLRQKNDLCQSSPIILITYSFFRPTWSISWPLQPNMACVSEYCWFVWVKKVTSWLF